MTETLKIRTEDFTKREIGPDIFVRLLMEELINTGRAELANIKRADLVFLYTKNLEEYRQKFRDIPVITRCGGVWSRRDWLDPMRKRWKESNALVYQNKWCKTQYERYFGETKVPYTIILNGTDIAYTHMKSKPEAVICSAKWRPTKRPELIREVAKRLPDVKFIVIGELRDPMPDNVEKVGLIPRSEVPKHLARGRVFFHTGRSDPCPNALVEAVASGLYPIVSSTGGAPEIIREGMAYMDPPDIEEIARFIRFGFDSGHALERHDLSIEHIANRYYDFFRYVLDRELSTSLQDT